MGMARVPFRTRSATARSRPWAGRLDKSIRIAAGGDSVRALNRSGPMGFSQTG